MATDDFDQVEIDRLVDELAHPPKRVAPKPAVAASTGPVATAAAPATAPTGQAFASLTRGRLWTTANVHMPAARTEPRSSFVSAAMARPQSFVSATFARFQPLLQTGVQGLKQMEWGTLTIRVFVALGALLSAAMPYWPYSHAWSWGLLLYLCAVELVVVTGIWGAKLTWDARLPAAHTVALGTVIWGLGLIVWEAAPRLAYV